jgi:hypothetical protein
VAGGDADYLQRGDCGGCGEFVLVSLAAGRSSA